MRILALTNLYPNPLQPHRAPYNRHQFRMLAHLHDLQVIAPIAWTDEWRALRGGLSLPSNRRVHHDGLTIDHPRYWYTPKILRRLYGDFFRASVKQAFRRAVAEFQPDVIFAPWAYPDGYAAVSLGREARLPVVVQVHGTDVRGLDQFPARRTGTAAALSQAEGVIAVSRDLAQGVVKLGALPQRVRVVIDGVDRNVFSPGCKNEARGRLSLDPNTVHLLFVGNLVPVKGVDLLLNACREIGRAIGPWSLHLIGAGPQHGALRRQARALGIDHQVVFHGALPHEQLPAWYRAADLFVLPSRSEGVPNVLLEAMACGLPFVASDVGGIPEIADLGASRLVPPERPLALARAMLDLLAAPPRIGRGPRDRREAVAEIAAFLESCAA